MKKVIILLCIILAIIIIIVGILYFKNNGLSFLNSNIKNDVNIEENGDVENASDSALNSLLKFLEEPSSNNIYAIFITDNIYQVLPTIVSRCEIIQFRPDDPQKTAESLQKQGIEEPDRYFLSVLCQDASFQEKEEYQLAVVALQRFVKDFRR